MSKRIQLQKLALQASIDEGKSYTVPEYIRSKLIDPHLNGQPPPSVPSSKQENVSPESEDTDSKKKGPWDDEFLANFEE